MTGPRWARVRAWVLVVAWMAMIFWLSAQPKLPDLGPDLTEIQDILGHFLVYAGLAFWLAPKPLSAEQIAAAKAAAAQPAGYVQVREVLDQRCVICHSADVQQKNVRLDTPQDLKAHAQAVYQQASVLKLMPLNNATQITDDERALIKRWYEAGAP